MPWRGILRYTTGALLFALGVCGLWLMLRRMSRRPWTRRDALALAAVGYLAALMQITGLLAISTDDDGDLNITIEKGPGEYVLNYAHLSQDTTYIVEQIETKDVSKYKYEIKFYPTNIVSGWYDVKLTDD